MDISLEALEEDSWEVAFNAVASSIRIPQNLPHIMRTSWQGVVDNAEFIRLLASPGLSTKCLLRAANLPQLNETAQAPELQAAVDILGAKASAVVLAINYICERTLDSGPPNRVWAPLFKEMMSEIEIGYHLGLSVDRVGHDQGMIVGFSRLAGLAVLLRKFPEAFTDWYLETNGIGSAESALRAFGCEPYQVSSILMQHLGLGTEVALATASTIGGLSTVAVELHPKMQTWTATYQWLQALKNGHEAPACEQSRLTFQELLPTAAEAPVPEHIRFLLEQVGEVRRASSLWTWHLPLPTYEETAKAIVYKVNSSTSGTTWTKGLVLNGQ